MARRGAGVLSAPAPVVPALPGPHRPTPLRVHAARLALAGLAALAAAVAACAPPPAPAPTAAAPEPRAFVAAGPGAHDLPAQRCGDSFLVETWIDGYGPFRLLLDTGAEPAVLDPTVARTVGLGERADSLRAGPLRARGVPVLVRPMHGLSLALGTRLDGILGHSAFAGVLLDLDYPAGSVRVAAAGLPRTGPGVTGTLPGRARPFVRARMDGRVVPLLVDSGFSGFLALAGLEGLLLEDEPEVVGASTRIDGVYLNRAARLEGDVELGVLTLRRPVAVRARSENLLGQEALRRFRVEIDTDGDRIRFTPGPEGADVPSPSRWGTGVAYRPVSAGRVVRWLAPDSPARALGLRMGDTVVARNGRRFDRRQCAAPFRPPDGPGTTVLVVARSGREVTIRVPRVRLVP